MHRRAPLPARLLAPVLALTAAVALAACSGDADDAPDDDLEPSLATPSGSGDAAPLPEGESDPLEIETYRVCLPIGPLGEDVLLREEYLEPTEDITLDSVDPVGADGFELVEAWVSASEQDPGGFFDTMPPSGEGVQPGYAWAERQPAVGAELTAEQGYHLFVHLRHGGSGEVGGIRLGYTSGGDSFEAATTNRYVAGRAC